MGRVGHKRQHKNIRDLSRKHRTRARTRDLDQIHTDLQVKNLKKIKDLPINPDLPGAGQFYCVECARHFIDDKALQEHTKSKQHRRRIKELKSGAYTQKDAELAAGLSTDNGTRSESLKASLQPEPEYVSINDKNEEVTY